MSSRESTVAFASTIPGFYGQDELESIYDCLINTPDGATVVEIGVFCGRSTSVILEVSRDKHFDIHLIDSFAQEGERAIRDFVTMASTQFSDVPFTLHRRNSDSLFFRSWPMQVGFLHVDGNHGAPGPQDDCKIWLPRLTKKAYAAFHDYHRGDPETFPAVSEAVDGALKCGVVERVRVVDSQIVVRENVP